MISLDNIDTSRVNDVLSGKRHERRCGLTTSLLLQLLSYARPENDGKSYLFVGETHEQVRELYRQFYYWLEESHMYIDMSIANMRYDVTFAKPSVPHGLRATLIAFLEKPYESPRIRFDFTAPSVVFTRGLHYNKIILDVTSETYHNNERRIIEAFRAEHDE